MIHMSRIELRRDCYGRARQERTILMGARAALFRAAAEIRET